MVKVGNGDTKMTLPIRAETAPGKWEDVGEEEMEVREVLWRRLLAGQAKVIGGQFTSPPLARVGTPYADWGWLYFLHDYEAPTTLRYVWEEVEKEEAMTVFLWNPTTGEGVSASGTVQQFKRARKSQASIGWLTIGWAWPEPAESVENTPSGKAGLQVTFTPGPAEASAVFGSEVAKAIRDGKAERRDGG
jgi:hypothetical protein